MPNDATITRLRLADSTPRSEDLNVDRDEFVSSHCPENLLIVGKSPRFTDALDQIRRVAQSRCNPVLIVGESGTGKELAARAVHAWRGGTEDNFVAVNCAGLTANLLESELFGHVRGAFTGADREKTGLFETAGGGTILLDEISEMPVDLQAKLLRVIQERCFRKVGGTKDIPCQATILASSNRDLLTEVNESRFRKDLYYRLAVFPIELPALRTQGRRSDIPLLARFFLATSEIVGDSEIRGFSPAAEQLLLAHDWPGNVRELRNVVDRAMILETTDQILPESIRIDHPVEEDDGGAHAILNRAEDFSLETAEREFIKRALNETGWQRTQAAGLLGITRATLHSKLKRYGITPPEQNQTNTTDSSATNSDAETRKEACA
jgi:DNA-binding NtrC family response regulator